MKINFTKMHGAGNDFIVIDDRSLEFPIFDQEFIKYICKRRTGVGSDGLLLIQPSDICDLKMRFINPDGNEVGMCGNGARCFARASFDFGFAPANMTVETLAGTVRAEVLDCFVRLTLTDPFDWRMALDVGLENPVDFVNTGVPHVVIRVDDLKDLDLLAIGSFIRNHSIFAPDGTNANFIKVELDGSLSIRTYERGVESETLACGTGATAAALLAARNGWVELPVEVHCSGGYDLTIDADAKRTTLSGDAIYVYEGKVEYGSRI